MGFKGCEEQQKLREFELSSSGLVGIILYMSLPHLFGNWDLLWVVVPLTVEQEKGPLFCSPLDRRIK